MGRLGRPSNPPRRGPRKFRPSAATAGRRRAIPAERLRFPRGIRRLAASGDRRGCTGRLRHRPSSSLFPRFSRRSAVSGPARSRLLDHAQFFLPESPIHRDDGRPALAGPGSGERIQECVHGAVVHLANDGRREAKRAEDEEVRFHALFFKRRSRTSVPRDLRRHHLASSWGSSRISPCPRMPAAWMTPCSPP